MAISKSMQRGVTATIFSLYFFAPTISAMSPALASMTAAYPDVSAAAMGYVVTITAILQACAALVAGMIAGRKVKFRTILIFAGILYVVAGCFPYFLADGQAFGALLVSRALFGVATGIVMPLSNALVMVFFQDESKRSGIVGIGNIVLSVGVIVTNLIGGYLCLISWQTTFLVHALGIVMLVLSIIFLPDSAFKAAEEDLKAKQAEEQETATAGTTVAKGKARFPMIAVLYLFLFLIVLVITQPLIVYNATLIAEAGIGTSVTAGYMTSVFSIGGMVASFAFKYVYAKIKDWILPLAYVFAILGALCGYLGTGSGSLALYAVSMFCAGVALLFITCFTPIVLSSIVAPELITMAMGFVSFITAAGTFLVTPLAQISTSLMHTTDVRCVLLVATAMAIVVGVISFVTSMNTMGKAKKAAERANADGTV